MAVDRERIYAALFARLRAKVSGQVLTFTRKYVDYDQVAASQQPALILSATHTTPENELGEPTRWRVNAVIVLYAQTSTYPDNPDRALSQLITAVEGALEWSPDDKPLQGASFQRGVQQQTTLGGLVSHCWISGAVEYTQGETGDQAVAIIPVEMLATA
jgi:hypothetical protein